MALNATLQIAGPAGGRQTPIRGVITGPFTTALEPGEIITAIEVPVLPTAAWGVAKLARKAGAYASSFAICLVDEGVTTLALGGAVRCPSLLDPDDLEASVAKAAPDGDDYDQHCHVVTARRAIAQALAS